VPVLTRRSLLAAGGVAAAAAVGVPAYRALTRPPAPAPLEPLISRCRFGAWAAGGDLAADHHALEQLVGARLPLVSSYSDWSSDWDAATGSAVAALGSEAGGADDWMISWEPVGVRLSDVLDGRHDPYLTAFVEGAATYPGRVILRLFPEMNGRWQQWSVDGEGGLVAGAEEWTRAWRHVVDLARGQKAANVAFMFCANTIDDGTLAMEDYWPGAEWVDVIGVDGYNWEWNADGAPLLTAEQVIEPMYTRLTALHPSAAFMVGEISCAPGPGKAAWFEALYTSRAFPRLVSVAFFHEAKERDWRLDSDPATLAVNRTYLARAPGPLTLP
jgi:hypothetical protein